MADTRTHALPQLRAADRVAFNPQTDAEVLQTALDRFKEVSTFESEERLDQLAALRFRSGEHSVAAMRGSSGENFATPTLTVDRQSAFIKQVINSYRKNPLSIRVRPRSGGATKQVSDILENKIREIEQTSEADQAYTIALDQAVGQGTGYFRLITSWVDEHSFEQEIKILPVYSRFSVYMDPHAVHPAALDADWCFVVERMSRTAFQAQYRMEPAPASQWQGTGDGFWYEDDGVAVADYFYKTWEDTEIVQFPNGTVVPTKDIGDIDPTWPKRTTRIPTVWWAKICGQAILSKTRWLGKHIPVIRVEGDRLDVDGRTKRIGIIQQTQNSQLAVDYAFSAEMEAIALSPKAPYILAADQLSGYEHYWNRANDVTLPYLPYKPVSVGSSFLPPPQRQSVEPAIQALTVARQQAAADMQAVLGVYETSLGAPSQEQSGVAVRSKKIEGDQATFHFPANLAWSIRAVGLQIVDILPKLYSRPTTLRQVGKDGAVTMTPVNQQVQNAQGEMEEHLLSQGSYDVAVDSGPAYSTQREMAAERLGELGRVLPEQMLPLVADLWVAQLDIPYAEEIAARLKTVVPPEALDATKDKNPQTAIAALQNQLQQLTQQAQQAAQALQQSQQTEQVATQQVKLLEQQVATMQARMADKTQENQIDVQKSQWDYEINRQKNELTLLELQLKYSQQAQMTTANGTSAAEVAP